MRPPPGAAFGGRSPVTGVRDDSQCLIRQGGRPGLPPGEESDLAPVAAQRAPFAREYPKDHRLVPSVQFRDGASFSYEFKLHSHHTGRCQRRNEYVTRCSKRGPSCCLGVRTAYGFLHKCLVFPSTGLLAQWNARDPGSPRRYERFSLFLGAFVIWGFFGVWNLQLFRVVPLNFLLRGSSSA